MSPVPGWLLLLSILGVSQAQREVAIQPGPLYRTMGSQISIWCKVRGYQGPSQQNFRWSVYLPSAPDREVQVVTTEEDPSFSYAIYSQRVRSGDIYVERLSGDHSLLQIRQLQERDTGEYECHTPNTDPSFHGSYSAKVNLVVIPDNLMVKMAPQSLRKTERDQMELTCQVSKASSQHTHLSVTWHLISEKDTQLEILTLTPQFVLRPGPTYTKRFASGEVRLDKLDDTSYRLSIMSVRLSDQGRISCQGSEWIQDPDKTWTKIIEKQSDKSDLLVLAAGGQDYEVKIKAADSILVSGKRLELFCSITSQGMSRGPFQVKWLHDEVTLGTWYSSGIPSYAGLYGARATKEQLVMGRTSEETWYLKIDTSGMKDGGSYSCQVTEEDNAGSGPGASRNSNTLSITVREIARNPQVTLSSDTLQVYEGGSVRFLCQTVDYSGSLSVAWYRVASSGQWVEVASLNKDGALTLGELYLQEHAKGQLVAEKMDSGKFTLKLERLSITDKGKYGCRVTEWILESYGGWKNITKSKLIEIDVKKLNSSLRASLSVRNAKITLGGDTELFCSATADYSLANRSLFWAWEFSPSSDPSRWFQVLVHKSPNEILSWGESLPGIQMRAQLSISEAKSKLRIYKVQREQSGTYRCTVGVQSDEPDTTAASATSNNLMIQIDLPLSQLMVDRTSKDLVLSKGQDQITMTCSVQCSTPGTFLSVSWFFHSLGAHSPLEILSVTQEGVQVSIFSPGAEGSKFHTQRVSTNTYILRILRPDHSQLGSYHCVVREWLRQESGDWIQLGERESGISVLEFGRSEKSLNIPKSNRTFMVVEGEDAVLQCPLGVVPSSASLYSVSWYYTDYVSHYPRLLVRAGWEGEIQYEKFLAKRLRLESASRGNYSLILQTVGHNDTGAYYCQAEEWRLGVSGQGWTMEDSDQSGYVTLNVTAPVSGRAVDFCFHHSLLYFLGTIAMLFLLLVLSLICIFLVRRKNRRGRSLHTNRVSIWSSLKGAGTPVNGSMKESEPLHEL
ncbi:immunoglobulin superfamily member 2-like [Pelobates fuscus]|uniref:immunoglobulin superfamily member 2-like n=1 Tax=Pelobates fuscus TaxID=191477 RepID=UPI002FE4A41E